MAYTLAYINKNMSLQFMELETFDSCFAIPEDLVFVGIRNGNETIFDPPASMNFSNIERLIIGLRGSFDLSFLKDEDYRRQNSQMCPVIDSFVPPELLIDDWDMEGGNFGLYIYNKIHSPLLDGTIKLFINGVQSEYEYIIPVTDSSEDGFFLSIDSAKPEERTEYYLKYMPTNVVSETFVFEAPFKMIYVSQGGDGVNPYHFEFKCTRTTDVSVTFFEANGSQVRSCVANEPTSFEAGYLPPISTFYDVNTGDSYDFDRDTIV